jgi:hypothetical protein
MPRPTLDPKTEDAVAELIAAAPELTERQRDKLRLLFQAKPSQDSER